MTKLILILLFFSQVIFSQAILAAETGPPIAAPKVTLRKPVQQGLWHSFFYSSFVYSSYTDELSASAPDGSTGKTRGAFQATGLSADWNMQKGRYLVGATAQILKGQVDFEQNVGFLPRKSFIALQAGGEVGYRPSRDVDVGISFVLLQRQVEGLGTSYAMGNFVNLRLRLRPRLALTQSLGNYSSGSTSAYTIGLRWLVR